jgi:putative flippase GtrA
MNTAFGYLAYALFVYLGMAPQPALAVAFAAGIIWNYFTHARLVFNNKGLSKLPAYVAAYLLIWGFNSGGLALLLGAGLGAYVAQALLAPAAAVFSFVLISKVLTGRFPFQKA